ncbi:MAG: AAA family ATPase [Smithellaceae bacterium]|nr:AAA family ATPase [Smithellaceae bacterium]
MNEPTIIAFLGKGGVGKTVLSALAGKILAAQGKRILYVDADPAMGLTAALELDDIKTIGAVREEIIRRAKTSGSAAEKQDLADNVDYLLLEALYECAEFGMVAMGQTGTQGCYCPVNNLLRSTISRIASQYEAVIIDAEAGIEQVNRQVVEAVHYPVIVTDNSKRGAQTAVMIAGLLTKVPKLSPKKVGVVFNRVASADADLERFICAEGIEYYGSIKADREVADLDRRGLSLAGIDPDAGACREMAEILTRIGIV